MDDRAHHRRVHAVFEAAMDLAPPERVAYLDDACDGDTAMRREIDALLEVYDEGTPDVLRSPVRAVSENIDADRVGDVLGGRYRLTRLIARGGMGTVYAAQQEQPVVREVAVKIVTPGMGTGQVMARFEAERQTLALMSHPHIARVLDAGTTDDGQPFFVMELVDGQPITTFSDERGLDVPARVRLFIDVCRGVQHAHQKGIIHRDLKPTNVLVTTAGDEAGEPKIIDFGIAKAIEPDLPVRADITEQRQILGTPEYMSPEQVSGSGAMVDTRSDIYSLGALLYRLLTGTTPHDATELRSAPLAETLRTIGEVDPPRPSVRTGDRALRGDLDWIVMRCLEKDPARRYETADALAQDLARHLASEPVQAGPPGVAYRTRKFVRRNRVGVSAAALVALAVLVGFTATVLALVSTTRARTELEASLVAQRIEQGRLHGYSGNAMDAERILWPEYLRDPDSLHAFWALRELHARHPRLASFTAHDAASPSAEVRSPNMVNDVAISADGTMLASAGRDGLVGLWDVPTWRERAKLAGHGTEVRTVCFAPDGTLASGGSDGVIIAWDTTRGQVAHRYEGHDARIRALRFSPDGETLLSACEDGTARLWTPGAATARVVLDDFGGTSPECIAFTPDGGHAVIGAHDGIVRIVDVAAGRVVRRLEGHRGTVMSVAVAPDGRTIASGSTDKDLRLWDLSTGACLDTFDATNGTILELAFADDGRTLLAAGWWRLDAWDVESGRVRELTTASRLNLIDPATGLAARGTNIGTVELWQIDDAPGVRHLPGHVPSASARVSADGRVLATADGAGTVRLWEMATDRLIREISEHEGRVLALAFSPDGARLATGGADATMRVWETATGQCIATFEEHESSAVDSVDFDPTGRFVAHTIAGGRVRVHDLDAGSAIESAVEFGVADRQVLGVAFSPDGERLATTSRDRTARVWDRAGRPVATLATENRPWGLAYDPRGTRIAFTGWGRTVEVWNAAGTSRLATLAGHQGTVWSVGWHPTDPRLLVSSADDATVKVWDVEAERCLATYTAFGKAGVYCVEFAPDGRTIVAAGRRGVALIDVADADRHIAGNLVYRIGMHRDEVAGPIPEARLRAWADEVLGGP